MRLSPLLRALLLFLPLAVGLGCGGGPSAPTIQVPIAANLSGNWLLAGSLPVFPFSRAGTPQLTMTFNVVGQQVTGTGFYSIPCTPKAGGLLISATGGTVVVSGMVAADGSFLLQTPSVSTPLSSPTGVTVNGTVPSKMGGAWQGAYVIDTTESEPACPQKAGGAVAASAIAPYTGTYVANGTFTLGASSTPVSISMSLQQGVQLNLIGGQMITDVQALTGTITALGVPCFHSGTVPQPSSASLGASGNSFGGALYAVFKMDDGSNLSVQGYVSDLAGTQLQQVQISSINGSCSVASGGRFKMGTFQRAL